MHPNNQESGSQETPPRVPAGLESEEPGRVSSRESWRDADPALTGPDSTAVESPPDPWGVAKPSSPAALDARLGRTAQGLAVWLVLLLVFGIGALLFRMEELAVMVVLAGLFVVSQAAD